MESIQGHFPIQFGSSSDRVRIEFGSSSDRFFTILVRTDLRIGVSGAKFDAEADFEVRLPLAPPKPREICEKRKLQSEIFVKKSFFASKNETLQIV